MASAQIMCLLLCLLSLRIRARSESSNIIGPGSFLSLNTSSSSWPSPSSLFAFGFYPQGDGFAVGIWLNTKPDITVVWTANRDDPPVSSNSSIHFTKDGRLLLRTGPGQMKPVVELYNPAVSASILDSGNFVIHGKKSEVIWQSFENPTDTLLGGQSISSYSTYSELSSSKSTFDHSTGRYCLEFNNGDLVAFPANRTPEEVYWRVPTVEQLNLTTGGVLQLITGNTAPKILASSSYSAQKETVIYRATLDADGILRLYSHRFKFSGKSNVKVEWFALKNQCEVKTSCGFNSYCYSNSSEADCKCFPGFDFINPGMRFLGCYRNFIDKEGCRRKETGAFYHIANMENTNLGGVPYARLSVNKEDCSESCLKDCHCAAALYFNVTCRIFKLPLMFEMKNQSDSGTVFVKWSSGNTNRSIPPRMIPPPLHERVETENKKKLITILAATLSSITFLCFVIAISSFLVYKIRVNRYRKLPGNSSLDPTEVFSLKSFSYNELDKATDGFKDELRRDWFGAVYRGYISNGKKMIAAKRLENLMEEGEKKFREEMATVRQTHHRNLLRLLGFCQEGSRKVLVYEYMGKGSLADFIFNDERRPLWRERVRIASDVARGIHYLHEECEFPIIHRDINPKTILGIEQAYSGRRSMHDNPGKDGEGWIVVYSR
ncbi:hypothetical protein Patl1_27788 [Pistacia atlantica]|uniref:Uncharacterized protein n=1 Tax=Pistacia atlantica TaxID=434234 RepID=A0ACC1BHG6_9ROSI|nr:hypothetical protein Patl1_27788 [Pistacia atlantica]